jgi:kumamolisin
MSAQPLKERRYLSREELAAATAPAPEDVAKVEKFAREHGLTIVKVSPESSSIFLSGTVAALSKAFGTKLSMYDSPRGKYRGRVGPVQVPADLAEIIVGVFGLDNRPAARPHSVRRKQQSVTAKDEAIDCPNLSYTPRQLAERYNFPTGLDGSGQCIGIVELGGGYTAKDMKAYFKKLGIATPEIVAVPASLNRPGSEADGEVALDIEVAGAIAPKAKIVVYFGGPSDKEFLAVVNAAINDKDNNPTVISISWGLAEDLQTPRFKHEMDKAFQRAALLGVTVFTSAGDDGSRDLCKDPTCQDAQDDGRAHVDFPASSPYVISCGGTRLDSSGETVWNDGPAYATGGGVSEFFPLPSWQANANVPPNANHGGKVGRGVPDVAGDADPCTGYVILCDGEWCDGKRNPQMGGTSAVAPLWAGLTALINQKLGKPIGYLNPLLYTNYGKLVQAGAFNDVTEGNNGYLKYSPHTPGYNAGPGWDPCTGLGTPNGAKLLQALQSMMS